MSKLIKSRLAELEEVIERLLFPALDQFTESSTRAVSEPDEPDEPDARTRVDAMPRFVTSKLEAIDLHIAEIFDEQALEAGLEVIGKRVSTKAGAELHRVVGISIFDAAPEISQQIGGWRAINVSRIKSLAGTELVEISQLLERSTAAGARVEVLRKAIQERFGGTRARADLLARDQTLTLNARIAKARQQSVGIEEYDWTTSGDERVRDGTQGPLDHAILDGTRHRWDTPPDVGDGRHLHPGEDYMCRCVGAPVLPELA